MNSVFDNPSQSSPAKGGVNRIDQKFSLLKIKNKKALILYMTAGDPSLQKNRALIYALEAEGVDLIELGVPFSDPLADGPVIQAASQRALKKHTNLPKILGLVETVRKKSNIPILLMSYLNPLLSYGYEAFAAAAQKSGVDGLIIPDLPPDEGRIIASLMCRHGIHLVYLAAPTSTKKRLKLIARSSKGFVYYVSVTGITGTRRSLPLDLDSHIQALKKMSPLPVCVGFGVSTPEQAKKISKLSDGVIIGSAVVKALALNPGMNAFKFSKKYVRPFVKALEKKS
ncbi:MAG: tryptophan synthase subunit alpha [Candidatus Omnitrophica bacterium CG1_02_46_14]|nr:MAG: tryptophan synthase subunit alpha [Candidatus Omnitrophica bacterium CG1_02_46_14]